MASLQKYQDLPTRGAFGVEQFSVNGSLFFAFANTDSFIYKLIESTRTFSLYQTIDTTATWDIQYFPIADKHYFAVANRLNRWGHSYQLHSTVYQWDGHQFVVWQNISTNGASSFNFFKLQQEPFLTVASCHDDTTHNINAVIYEWKDNHFKSFRRYEPRELRQARRL